MGMQVTFSRRRFLAYPAGAAALALIPATLRVKPAVATAGDFYAVAVQGLRLRSGPGLRYGVLASLSKGTNVELLAWGGTADGYDWARVRVVSSGKTGFVAYEFLTPVPSDGLPIGQVVHVEAGGGVGNLRSGPGTGYRVLKRVATGTTGTVTGGPAEANGYFWYQVRFGSVTGWIVSAVLVAGAGPN
jgi:uncharacterized protein YgiM (DUF1202 family)